MIVLRTLTVFITKINIYFDNFSYNIIFIVLVRLTIMLMIKTVVVMTLKMIIMMMMINDNNDDDDK